MRSTVLVLLVAAAVEVAAADDCAKTSIKQSPAADSEAARGGLRAYADPETGELLSPDAVAAPSAAGSGGAERKQVLVVVPAPTEAGGVMVDLRGQFKHETRVHLADGNVSADCISATSPP